MHRPECIEHQSAISRWGNACRVHQEHTMHPPVCTSIKRDAIGRWLVRERKKLRVSGREIGRMCGFPDGNYAHYETGRLKLTEGMLRAIEWAFDEVRRRRQRY